MTDALEDVLTARELKILNDSFPAHLNRWDIENPPTCEHCFRPASYALILGECIDQIGRYSKDVCDACLERCYGELDLPLGARMYDA